MAKAYPFLYNRQFERYLGQFGRVLSGFQVEDGVEREGTKNRRRINVVHGSADRVIAHMINNRDSFSNSSLPVMAFHIASIQKDELNKKSHYHEDTVPYKNADGDHKAFNRMIGPSFNLLVDVNILASSLDEMYSIIEQILLVFNPRVTIQIDNSIMNDDYITDIFLEQINNEITYPTGTEKRVVQKNLQFRIPVRLSYPVNPDAPIIETIRARILADTEGGIETMVLEEIITGE